jgi:hypothetical protein
VIGNLCFSTWISFILMTVIFTDAFRDYMSYRGEATATFEPASVGDVEVGGTVVMPEIEADKFHQLV